MVTPIRAPDNRAAGPESETADVRLEGASKRFGDVWALRPTDLEIARGEFFSLLGASGSGKTTTLRLIGGFEEPSAGRIYLQNRDVTSAAPYDRPVNTVFQDYALFPHMTVAENIGYGLKVKRVERKERARRVGDALDLVRLSGLDRRRPSQLSGGQRQRVALARALINTPAVLLLDEPLGALDLKLRREMQLELKRIQREVGITFIYVTHDQEEAMSMADRIAVMRDGTLEQVGPPSTVYEHPANAFVAGFVGVSNILAGRVIACDGVCRIEVPGIGPILAATADRHVGEEVLIAVRPEKIQIHPDSWAGSHALRGRVADVSYAGAFTRYDVTVGDQSFAVLAQNQAAGPIAVRGEDVDLSWAPDSTIILPGSVHDHSRGLQASSATA
ncbi:MAG TPA: ABC transporter ATP-binding protein [Chloroflexota bacterium]|nr:ABC transporter ATP-binding protein [Chloroflexota bacterium]